MMNKKFLLSNLYLMMATLFVFFLAGVVSVVADVASNPFDGTSDPGFDQSYDDSLYTSRSNVMGSTVDPSFWDDRKPLSIGKVEKRLVLPASNPNNPSLQSGSQNLNPSSKNLTAKELALVNKAQEAALMLVNVPYYQAGESVFKLDDKQHVQLSSVKYAATREYYGRTDVSSSWVTDFYDAAYSDDYNNLTALLKELPAEVRTPSV